jgi:CheY-like chemotaxis protein
MTQPLALVLYERILPGSQVVNRLQDLNYRVQTVAKPGMLVESAQKAKALVVLADVGAAGAGRESVLAAVAQLKKDPATRHIPVIAFGGEEGAREGAAAQTAGVTLWVGETAILSHLPQILDQALEV